MDGFSGREILEGELVLEPLSSDRTVAKDGTLRDRTGNSSDDQFDHGVIKVIETDDQFDHGVIKVIRADDQFDHGMIKVIKGVLAGFPMSIYVGPCPSLGTVCSTCLIVTNRSLTSRCTTTISCYQTRLASSLLTPSRDTHTYRRSLPTYQSRNTDKGPGYNPDYLIYILLYKTAYLARELDA